MGSISDMSVAALMSPAAKIQMAYDIRRSIRELQDRGLLVASKWASELLASLPKQYRTAPNLPFSPPPPQAPLPLPQSSPAHGGPRPSIGDFLPTPGGWNSDLHMDTDINAEAGPSRPRTRHGVEIEEEDDILEEDEFQLAKSYFDIKELDRVVHVLRDAKGSRARFLRYYAAYLSADRKAQESLSHFLDSKEERSQLYPAVNQLLTEIRDDNDPYLVYLRGLMHMRLEQREEAVECFVQSVKDKPYNWSCWSQLAQVINSADMFIDVKERMEPSVMFSFFAITAMLDLHTATELVIGIIQELQEVFPTSLHLQAQRALVMYHMRDFENAEKEFDKVQRADPYRMEDIDIYSNMLYVMDKRAKLGKLAHEYAEIDRNRPEVCCLIGNYYSSRLDHTKAITYFKRALTLNREYLPAWTLMGHEFVELKNSHAAIEAYRRAIDVNAKDYRAWYGLGQAYELLDMPMYAIEYYNHATSLRPYDCRMWQALATVYESLDRLSETIQCHTRALLGADRLQTPGILFKLAALYTTVATRRAHEQGRGRAGTSSSGAGPAGGQGYAHVVVFSPEAVECHRKILALGEQARSSVVELAASYLAVAEWEAREVDSDSEVAIRYDKASGSGDEDGAQRGDWALAAQYLEKVAQSHAAQRDRAAELLKQLRLREARHM